MLRPIEDALAAVIHALTAWTGSVGLAVVLMTVLIRLVLHPLTRWSLNSMKRMQALMPQIEVLRRKYKDDPQQANLEIMKLYRSSGANPFTGCLPLFIQFPVLIALFRVLQRQELFAAQTFLGIPLDSRPSLSAIADNPVLLVIPVLMGVTTYLQQRLSITDPQQARMFVIMPILFAWFSLSFPVGLSLYWIVSTVVYIGEYLLVVGPPRRSASARAPARRAAKTAEKRS
ncbi:MAG: YidC/Oxa1 family membrane protein insertase [Armatimonadota bacterium]|nr:YidC/Oxa1 family membrane protein insertase [Armatimonadota bacterium]MDR7478676.1 YidC/Oxa1 family membrane protein insertase [Armatimonadota bacterium]MDR7489820.1 YidC/Oxa1 family membrane protein insertase [Armatimonadota bacterium]MDR7500823.1 YidC/Oxa1 family membrane protein insertase [Armatimonadota bacterium]MDR7526518.1 YidC/Oxa1 family membrane protein insertase [Armatimonadota bacterium]